MINQLLTVAQAAAEYNIPKWKLYRAIREGILPSTHFVTKRRLLLRADIEAAIAANLTGGNHA